MKDLGRLKIKLKPLYAAMLPLMTIGWPMNIQAADDTCIDGNPAIVHTADCTVATALIPTTVKFEASPTGKLILNGAAPALAVINSVDNEGVVQVDATTATTSANTYGVASGGRLGLLQVNSTFNLGSDFNVLTTNVAGFFNQTAGTLTTTNLNLTGGFDYFQSSGAFLNATNVSIATGSVLRLREQNTAGTVTFNGAGAQQGQVRFFASYNPDAAIGGTFSLNSIIVDAGTLTLDDFDVDVRSMSIAAAAVNHSAGELTTDNTTNGLFILGSATYTQSGSAVLNSNILFQTGSTGTVTLVNQNTAGVVRISTQVAGEGNLIFAGDDWDTDATIGIVSGFNLNSITVNSGTTLILDQAASATTITIKGILDKRSGNGITGATTINDGGSMTVAAGFTHTGALTIGQGLSGSLDVAGNTVNITGTFDMAAGATFNTTINDATGDAGKIVATGAATVAAGTTINIDTGAVTLVAGTTYKVIDGDGSAGVNVPTAIIDNNATFNFVGSVVSGDLLLTVQFATLVPPSITGLTPNATAVAAEVDALITSDPEIAAAFFTLSTTEEFNDALESLAPDMSGAVQSATFAAHHFAIDNVEKRLASLRTGGGMMTGMSAGDPYQDVGMWLQGYASTIDQDNRDLVAGFSADTVGVAFGVDKLLNNNLLVGAALSYAATDVDTNGSGNTTDIDSYQGGLYATYESGPWYMDGIFYYSYNEYDGRRTIPLVGRVANADYDANQFGVKATLGREYSFNADTYLTPYLGLYYVYLDVDDYTETGAGAANLTVDNEDNQALQSTLGVSLRREVETATGLKMVPEAHVAWLHEFLDEGQINTSTFTGGGGSFTTRGFDPANDSFNIGASLAIYSENNIDVKASYDFEVKDDYDSHSGLLVFRYTF